MIVICDFMVNNLRLRGDQLLVFAIIFGFTQYDGAVWHLDYEYISKRLGLTEQAIDSELDDLCSKDFIKFVKPDYVTITIKEEFE